MRAGRPEIFSTREILESEGRRADTFSSSTHNILRPCPSTVFASTAWRRPVMSALKRLKNFPLLRIYKYFGPDEPCCHEPHSFIWIEIEPEPISTRSRETTYAPKTVLIKQKPGDPKSPVKEGLIRFAIMSSLTAGALLMLFSRPPKTLSAFTLEATHRHRSVISA